MPEPRPRAARAFCAVCANKTEEKKKDDVKYMKTEYLLQKEIERVLGALTPGNALVVRVMLHTGLRVSDALRLTFPLREQMWITEGKTGKRRHIGLPRALIDEICRRAEPYIPQRERRHIYEAPRSGPRLWVFPSPRDYRKHRTRQAVWKDIKRAARAYRIPANAGPHSMRKVYAVQLLRKYGDIERVRRALNHTDDSVTLIYAMADKMMSDNALSLRLKR